MPAESGRFSLVKEIFSSSLLELSALDEDTELELFWEELLSALDEDTELELFWEELLSALDEISLFELEGIFSAAVCFAFCVSLTSAHCGID